jgi:CBS domain-containing protein
MTPDVVTLSPEVTILDAMGILSSHHVQGAPVVRGPEVVGVISATDLMAFAASVPGVPIEQLGSAVDDEWETPPEWQTGDDSESNYFTELWTDAGADTSVRFAALEGPEWNVLLEHTVSEAMTAAPVHMFSADTPVRIAAELMGTAQIHRVLVTDGSKLLGIVTTMDITRAVAAGMLTSRTYVFGNRDDFTDPR